MTNNDFGGAEPAPVRVMADFGAALDVFASEPNLDARFLDLPNCILQPHASVYTRENRRDLMAEVIRLLGL